jgi:AraC-like DNA-binding protein
MSKGRVKLAMSQGVSVWVIEAPHGFGEAAFHAHHAIQITASLAGDLVLSSEQETLNAPIIAVSADNRHRFDAHGLLAFIFVEPESRLGRSLTANLFAQRSMVAVEDAAIGELLRPLSATFQDDLDDGALLRIASAAVEHLVPQMQAKLPDPRVQKIIDYAIAHIEEPVTLECASEGIYLSPSRLRHLFVEQTGLAFRTYLVWLRIVKAVQVYSEGCSLTEAAHAAGFSDSAHFSRIFRRTFGLPATSVTRV